MEEMRNTYNILIRIPEGKKERNYLGESNIRFHLRDIGWEGVDWMHLDRAALVDTVMKLHFL
jgi:hypothetical protein